MRPARLGQGIEAVDGGYHQWPGQYGTGAFTQTHVQVEQGSLTQMFHDGVLRYMGRLMAELSILDDMRIEAV